MQIKSLWIKEYKNLKDFRINFEHQVSVLIWKNWSGKSNILEAILLILNSLYWKRIDIDYEINFWYNSDYKDIKIKKDFNKFFITNNSLTKEYKKITFLKELKLTKHLDNILPDNIICYYWWFNSSLKKKSNYKFSYSWIKYGNVTYIDYNVYNIILLWIYFNNRLDYNKKFFKEIWINDLVNLEIFLIILKKIV